MIKGLYEAHLPVSNLENSIVFYKKLGLELAYQKGKVTFFWIVKGESGLGLWESDNVHVNYHPSIRHLAFKIEEDDLEHVKEWLSSIGIEVRTEFGPTSEHQPLVLSNNPHAHGAIYFSDPDGNSLELITPLRLDDIESFNEMSLRVEKTLFRLTFKRILLNYFGHQLVNISITVKEPYTLKGKALLL